MTESIERADDDDASLPFDVELEQLPVWVHVASALVIAIGVLVALGLVHMLVFLPFLAASSIGRRFATIATHVEVGDTSVDIGERTLARADIVDVWLDDDPNEARVTVASGESVDLAILHFQNREQAKRFAAALRPKREGEQPSSRPHGFVPIPVFVAGHRPRPVDWLASLRFVAVAAAFFGTGSPLGVLVLAIFAFGAATIVRAKQLVARTDRLEVRSAFGVATYPYADIERVDVEDGVVHLAGGGELAIPRTTLRDTLIGTGAWLERARTRVLAHVSEHARRTSN